MLLLIEFIVERVMRVACSSAAVIQSEDIKRGVGALLKDTELRLCAMLEIDGAHTLWRG